MLRLIVFLLLVPLSCTLAANEPVRVVLYPVIRLAVEANEPRPDTVRLGSLARIVADLKTQRSLLNLEVPVRSFDGASEITRGEMMRILAMLPELQGAEILGPKTISVAQEINAARVDKAIEEVASALQLHIDNTWPGQYRNLQLRLLDDSRQLPLASTGDYKFDFAGIERLSRRTPVWVAINDKGKSRRVAIWFDVSGETLVWTALSDMEAKSVALESDFAERWRNIADINRGVPVVPSLDQRLVTTMSTDEILTELHLEPVPAVDYGADTQVISRVGHVKIQTVATALETAYVGDLINMRSNSSDENFEARVLGANLVQIESSMPVGSAAVHTGLVP